MSSIKNSVSPTFFLSILLFISGCSTTPEDSVSVNSITANDSALNSEVASNASDVNEDVAAEQPKESDLSITDEDKSSDVTTDTVINHGDREPLEGFNRMMWGINYDVLDPYVVRPLSIAYMEWTPIFVRSGFNNFLDNFDEPASGVNNLLMGKGEKAIQNISRFIINSTIGLFGLIDVASAADIPRNTREFGDVLGHYGVGNGIYIMAPAYGPLTVRDLTDTVDTLYMPLNWLVFWQKATKWAFQGLESRYELISQEGQLQNSPDPYALSKSIYLQHQDFKADIKAEQEEVLDEDLLEDYLGHDY